MQILEVESSNLKGVGYDEKTHTLGVEFKSGSKYFYVGVPTSVWKRFEEAPSKGQFFSQSIKPHYDFFQLETPVLEQINEEKK
jgi:lysyl-tRNA synthetase class 2